MEKSSSISSSSPSRSASKRAGRWPWGVLWAAIVLALFEARARSSWTPLVVGEETFAKIDATYGYGFELSQPLCLRDSDDLRCFASQYISIVPQRVRAAKGPETRRFITLGGSLSYGAKSYTPEAVKRLRAACPDVEWQGLNFSVRGMGTSRMRVLFEDALRYEPDFLVIDPVGSNEYEDEGQAAYRAELHHGIWALLLRSRAVVLGQKLFLDKLKLSNPRAPKPPKENEAQAARDAATTERWFQTHRKNLADMLAIAGERSIPVILMSRGRIDFKVDHLARIMAHWRTLAGPNVHFVPIDEAFEKLEDRRSYFTGDRNHYSAKGHALIAEALAGVLRSATSRCGAATEAR